MIQNRGKRKWPGRKEDGQRQKKYGLVAEDAVEG
jgi:hypothetical protein